MHRMLILHNVLIFPTPPPPILPPVPSILPQKQTVPDFPPRPHSLERPCMDHMQFLLVRAHNNQDSTTVPSDPHNNNTTANSSSDPAAEAAHNAFVSGHALMATCPPGSHIQSKPEEPYPHQMPDIAMPDLMKLLDLSNRLPLDGEITPIMAWAMVLREPRFGELSVKDVEGLKGELVGKVRCYG